MIPAFRNSKEAFAYGQMIRGDIVIIKQLKETRERILKKNKMAIKNLRNLSPSQLNECMRTAVKCQFYREALESAEEKNNFIRG